LFRSDAGPEKAVAVAGPRKRTESRIDRREATRTALVLTVLFWCILLYPADFDAAMSGKLRGVLGARPAGMPYDLFILLFTLQLSVPMFVFFRNLLITARYARKRRARSIHAGDVGAVFALIGYLGYLVKDTGEGPEIRRSKVIAFAGILYLIGIIAWWIWWTGRHGI
jgi:hypothetical protein